MGWIGMASKRWLACIIDCKIPCGAYDFRGCRSRNGDERRLSLLPEPQTPGRVSKGERGSKPQDQEFSLNQHLIISFTCDMSPLLTAENRLNYYDSYRRK
jgi:hypothetical protein